MVWHQTRILTVNLQAGNSVMHSLNFQSVLSSAIPKLEQINPNFLCLF